MRAAGAKILTILKPLFQLSVKFRESQNPFTRFKVWNWKSQNPGFPAILKARNRITEKTGGEKYFSPPVPVRIVITSLILGSECPDFAQILETLGEIFQVGQKIDMSIAHWLELVLLNKYLI